MRGRERERERERERWASLGVYGWKERGKLWVDDGECMCGW